MSEKKSPLFRKAMNGYNKDDVNNYIIETNAKLKETTEQYEGALEKCNKRAEDDHKEIVRLTEENNILKKQVFTAETMAKVHESTIEEYSAVIDELKAKVDALETELSEKSAYTENDKEKAEYYDSLCAKAGEILVIASGTAEDILNRANVEATKIVGDANNKKDLMLKTFSDSACAAADDINVYIKKAVNQCINKINKSVSEVTNAVPAASKKPRTVFINENKQTGK